MVLNQITESEFGEKVLKSPLPVLVDFRAGWSASCRQFDPLLDEIARDYSGRLAVAVINVDEAADLARGLGVINLPTLVLYRAGRPVAQTSGALSKKEVINWLSENLEISSGREQPRILFNSDRINERVKAMARQIEDDFRDQELVLIAVLKGSVLFLADLVRWISRPLAFDFIGVSSYEHSRTSLGVVTLDKEIKADVRGKSVLIVDDILDSGRTLGWIKEHLKKFGPREVKVCVLLEKEVPRIIEVKADYVGFKIPNVFVYGYGLDLRDRHRNLPHIAALEET